MNVFAALVPPVEVLDRVRAAVDGVPPVSDQPADTRAGRHRLVRRKAPAPPPLPPMLDLLPTDLMNQPVARFGNLATPDARRLGDRLAAEAASWPAPRLHLAGGLALDPEGDDSVWVGFGGDLDELNAVGRGVVKTAQAAHLFVDRRGFRPHLQLGTVNDDTTTTYLEAVVELLDHFESASWWQTSISLLTPVDQGGERPTYKVYRDIPLGEPVTH